ncbi:SUMF1/EgtB/PvdO family nonheme iron enzyme [Candidatus Kaiserbacteria bacterium]|nr:SUMF1/EgtB/PvdO family nonheme iron enzyme [Candidatus Kaiserbacteria bacterium]
MNGWRLFFRSVFVLIGVVLLTSFTIDATDSISGSETALSILATKLVGNECPVNTKKVVGDSVICVDIYENSAGDDCPYQNPKNSLEVKVNVDDINCQSVSLSKQLPLTNVNYHQADLFCHKKGGRLPTPEEWYEAALGTPDNSECNLNGPALLKTGQLVDCVSVYGAKDMVGNVWEWTEAEIIDGDYNHQKLPSTGYVSEVTPQGLPLLSSSSPSAIFGNDYVWSLPTGTYVMMRGGYYGSGDDGGVNTVQATVLPSFSSVATGFRCVVDL